MDEPSISLHRLTNLTPRRGLSHQEAVLVAEQQANKLLWLGRITKPPVPVVQLVQRTGIAVEHDPTVNKLGLVVPLDDGWHIRYPDPEALDLPDTVAHLFKLIVDQPFGDGLYPPMEVAATHLRKHYIAEYFATCLVLPQEWIEQWWHSGQRDVDQLAAAFATTPQAMRFRLRALRLIPSEPVPHPPRPDTDPVFGC